MLPADARTDRGTGLSFNNREGLTIIFEGDPHLFNPYGVLLVDPQRHPHVKQADAMRCVDWLTGAAGHKAIAGFGVDGMPLFFPDAPSS
jgi:tungstate transport system substrate-binding protein